MNVNETIVSSVEETINPVLDEDFVPYYKRERYPRNRPFLLINIARRPAEHVKTNKAGWVDDLASWKVFEQTSIVDRVNTKHLRESTVIIDILNSKVVKNGFIDDPEEKVVNHFMNKYSAQITEAMQIWLNQVAKVAAEQLKA